MSKHVQADPGGLYGFRSPKEPQPGHSFVGVELASRSKGEAERARMARPERSRGPERELVTRKKWGGGGRQDSRVEFEAAMGGKRHAMPPCFFAQGMLFFRQLPVDDQGCRMALCTPALVFPFGLKGYKGTVSSVCFMCSSAFFAEDRRGSSLEVADRVDTRFESRVQPSSA